MISSFKSFQFPFQRHHVIKRSNYVILQAQVYSQRILYKIELVRPLLSKDLRKSLRENYLAFVCATVSCCNKLNHQSPILASKVVLSEFISFRQRRIRYELEAIIFGEHSSAMAKNVPITSTNPGKL